MASVSNLTSLAAFVFVLVGAGATWRMYGTRIKAAYFTRVRGRDYVPLPVDHDRSASVEGRFIV